MSKTVKLSIVTCARCGHDHPNLAFKELKWPIRIMRTKVRYTHWALCPKRKEPIIMNVMKVK